MITELYTRRTGAVLAGLCLAALLPVARPAFAYDGEIHQQLTFLAAKQFNRCVATSADIPRLTALQVRYIARANVAQAEGNMFVRMFRWHYYNHNEDDDRSLLWVINTRFDAHFAELVNNLDRGDSEGRQYAGLGRVINYVQDVTSPPQAVPVYTGRFWRFNVGDRFNSFAIDSDQVAHAVQSACVALSDAAAGYREVLRDAAAATLESVRAPIFGMPTTWQAFWKIARTPGDFGEYGRAGNNFGRKTDFRCGEERCVLLKDDPLYLEFAQDRHAVAVVATMRALLLMQMARAGKGLTTGVQDFAAEPGQIGGMGQQTKTDAGEAAAQAFVAEQQAAVAEQAAAAEVNPRAAADPVAVPDSPSTQLPGTANTDAPGPES